MFSDRSNPVCWIVELSEKVKNGYEPTPDEIADVHEYVKLLVEIMKPVMAAFMEMAQNMAKSIDDWWNTLDPEVQKQLRTIQDRHNRAEAPVVKNIQYGIPTTNQSMRRAVADNERDILTRIAADRERRMRS